MLPQQQVAGDLRGTVEGLAVAPTAEAPMQPLQVAQARARRELDGDRYAAGAGTFSPRAGRRPGYDLTLIAAEVLDEMAASGPALDFAGTRRNVLTRGIDVNAWSDGASASGGCSARGAGCASPAPHLDRLGGPGVLRPLIHRGGLRADILTDGEIRLGEPILPAWSPLDAGGSRAAVGNHGPDRRAQPPTLVLGESSAAP